MARITKNYRRTALILKRGNIAYQIVPRIGRRIRRRHKQLGPRGEAFYHALNSLDEEALQEAARNVPLRIIKERAKQVANRIEMLGKLAVRNKIEHTRQGQRYSKVGRLLRKIPERTPWWRKRFELWRILKVLKFEIERRDHTPVAKKSTDSLPQPQPAHDRKPCLTSAACDR